MRLISCAAFLLHFLAADCVLAQKHSPEPLAILQEAYQAATNNLVSGSGTGSYEIYAAPSVGEPRLELRIKAKTKIFFDHDKFHIRLDYEKDDDHRYDSRIIIYDGTAILVSRISKRIHPAGSEGDIYEEKAIRQTLRQAGFDYNPCQMPPSILHVDWLSEPNHASNLSITQDANKDYSGSYVYTSAPNHLRATFLASHRSGYNITNSCVFLTDYNNHPYETYHVEWERKKNIWFVKSIDYQESPLGGRTERSLFKYTDFEPNVEVSPTLFKFEALGLTPNARVIDRRPNAEEPVLHQSPSNRIDTAKLDSLADTVKALTSSSVRPQPSRLGKHSMLISGALVCLLGLLLLWRRRARKKGTAPNP